MCFLFFCHVGGFHSTVNNIELITCKLIRRCFFYFLHFLHVSRTLGINRMFLFSSGHDSQTVLIFNIYISTETKKTTASKSDFYRCLNKIPVLFCMISYCKFVEVIKKTVVCTARCHCHWDTLTSSSRYPWTQLKFSLFGFHHLCRLFFFAMYDCVQQLPGTRLGWIQVLNLANEWIQCWNWENHRQTKNRAATDRPESQIKLFFPCIINFFTLEFSRWFRFCVVFVDAVCFFLFFTVFKFYLKLNLNCTRSRMPYPLKTYVIKTTSFWI